MGELSGWFYGMTEGVTALADAREDLVHTALYQVYRGQLGDIGYHGTDALDGTDFGAEMGESWCSEFYSSALGTITGIGSKAGVSGIRDWFEAFDDGADHDLDIDNSNRALVRWFAQPGDYLAEDTDLDGDINHSAMFLAWDAGTGEIITLDGNTSGRSDLDSGTGRGGDEASLRRRDPAVILGWGWLAKGMLE